ncbi:hypothetical protein R6V09_12425 [Streptomyces sp. W16]|nr:hypothetical protein [Streptomyces sp. W16]MDV9170937.1 hypothetical protein [Streptomyces sp. W16]
MTTNPAPWIAEGKQRQQRRKRQRQTIEQAKRAEQEKPNDR